MVQTRRAAHTAIAVIATVLVLSGVAFGATRLVRPGFGTSTRLRAEGAALVNGLPAVESRDATDPGDAKRWSAVATVVVAAALAAGVLWRRLDLGSPTIAHHNLVATSGRGPPAR